MNIPNHRSFLNPFLQKVTVVFPSPDFPSTKSQTASLVSLKRLLGESYWKSILKKKERKRNSRQKEGTPLPPTQLWRNCLLPVLRQWNPKEKHRTKRASQKQHSTLTCSGPAELMCWCKKKQRAFHRLLMPKDGAATDEFWLGRLGNVHSYVSG